MNKRQILDNLHKLLRVDGYKLWVVAQPGVGSSTTTRTEVVKKISYDQQGFLEISIWDDEFTINPALWDARIDSNAYRSNLGKQLRRYEGSIRFSPINSREEAVILCLVREKEHRPLKEYLLDLNLDLSEPIPFKYLAHLFNIEDQPLLVEGITGTPSDKVDILKYHSSYLVIGRSLEGPITIHLGRNSLIFEEATGKIDITDTIYYFALGNAHRLITISEALSL